MPLAICCSPKAAVSMSARAGCVVENSRVEARVVRDTAAEVFRTTGNEFLGSIVGVVILISELKLKMLGTQLSLSRGGRDGVLV